MIYSNDGLIFLTRDHYRTFTQASIGIFRTFVEVDWERVESLLRETTPGRPTKGPTTQYIRNGGGGFAQANVDFNGLSPRNVREVTTPRGTLRTGTLPDGRTITVRSWSSDTRPTLEIRNPNTGRGIEIRYDE